MAHTYNLADYIGQIRLNTFGNDSVDPIFQDDEISALYQQEGQSVKRASARVLEIVATREAYIQKVIKLLALSTNGPALAAELRAQARELRDQAANEDLTGVGAPFDIVENYREQE